MIEFENILKTVKTLIGKGSLGGGAITMNW